MIALVVDARTVTTMPVWIPPERMSLLDQAFDLRGPDALRFGRGRVAETGDCAARFGDRALLVTDPGVRAAGLAESVVDSLETAGLDVEIFDGIESDPSVSVAHAAAEAAAQSDVIVGLGGGSPMDVTKAAAATVASDRSLLELLESDDPLADSAPTILLPTTSGTGSEVSPAAVLFDDDGEKRGLIDPVLFADVALVDPDLSMQLPSRLTAGTGLDAFAHAVGSYISTDSNEFADALCLRAMDLVETHLRDATFYGGDAPEARVGMSMAATLAMLGRVNGGKSAIHSVAYGVGALYHVPHAEAIAAVMPAVLEYNAPAALDRFASLGDRLYDASGSRRHRAATFVAGVRSLRDDVGFDGDLTALGAAEGDLDALAEASLASERHLRASPRSMDVDDALELLSELL
ncbi:iron-containing alcohol dehydrogenase [Natronomonas salsuginis]|uniref:Iron-containing alcohol dehydrogenase n=2 Tax=Natronomonas salsuginis TaxID=2217661 RepID=A0A4U5JBJ6_9EURY|nr:iron-containing alcohol dehydrogenase [Natronomonas salsuginis]